MRKIEPYPVALALFFILAIFYTVCIGMKLILDQFGVNEIWHMHRFWISILPGFTGLNLVSILIGYLEVTIGAYSLAYITIPIYNYFVSKTNNNNANGISGSTIIVKMKTIFFTLMTFFIILFSICFIYDLFIPQKYSMFFIWQAVLPGVKELSISNFIIGVFDIIIYSIYTSFIFSKTLNYFEKVKTEEIFINKGE